MYRNRDVVYKIIRLIEYNIDILNRIRNKRTEFSKYEIDTKLVKHSTHFDQSDIKHFKIISQTHKTYKTSLDSNYQTIKKELKKLKKILQTYKFYLHFYYNSLYTFKIQDDYIKKVESIRVSLIILKFLILNNLNTNDLSFKKLEEIGEHVRTMKSNLNQVLHKVEEKAKNYIAGLNYITINKEHVKKEIRQIKSMNNLVIGKLQIAKHTIQFYKSLESEINNLNDVEFHDYNFTEFLKNSQQIKEKLTSFETKIKSILEKLKQSFNTIKRIKVVVQGDTYDESYYKNLISPVQNFIDNTLKEISTIRYIVYYLLIIKSNSIRIDFVKNKINEIKDVDTAIKNLPEILRLLRTFYLIHRNSMNMVIIFNFISFARHSINQYVNSLSLVKYDIEILIFAIKCYIVIFSVIQYVQNNLNQIRTQIEKLMTESNETKKLEGYISNIINSLKSVNSSIKSLKRVNDDLDNIKRLKNNILKIKHQIKQVYQNVLEIKVNLNGIIKIRIELYNIKSEILKVQKNINDMMIKIISFFNYLRINYIIIFLLIAKNYILEEKRYVFIIHSISVFKLIENLIKIVDYLNGIKSVIDQMGINQLIEDIESKIKTIEKSADEIEKYNKLAERSVTEVECAIEGVVLNFIKCSTKQLSTHIINLNEANNNRLIKDIEDDEVDNQVLINYSLLSVNQYKDLVNRLYESAKKIDQILQLNFKIYICKCIFALESTTNNRIILKNIYLYNIMDNLANKSNDEFVKFLGLDKIGEISRLGMIRNHVCLCMVIKYLLYPQIINIIQLLGWDLNMLSTISRKYDKYTDTTHFRRDVAVVPILVIDILERISKWVNKNYYVEWTVFTDGVEIECYCKYYRHRRYYSVVSIMLVLSSLMENIWSMDSESLRTAIECLSTLMSEFDMIDSQNNYLKFGNLTTSSLTKLPLKDLNIQISKKIINTCLNSFFKFILSLSIMEYFEFSTVVYSIISSLMFYLIFNPVVIIKSIPTFLKTGVMSISIQYLECTKKECNCADKKGCKMCVFGKIRFLRLKITFDMIRYGLGSIIKNTMIDTMSLTNNVNREFVRNACVNSNIQMLRITKKLLTNNDHVLRSYGNIGVTNVETRNWGYDTKYEHGVSTDKGISKGDQYPYVSNSGNSYSNPNVRSSRMFKMNNIKLNTS